jgi:hypothetical protein
VNGRADCRFFVELWKRIHVDYLLAREWRARVRHRASDHSLQASRWHF